MNIEQALKTQLSAIEGLNNKVFPIFAPQDTKIPYLTYSLNATERSRDLHTNYNGLVESRYELRLFHTNYANLVTIRDSIITKLKTMNIGAQEIDITSDSVIYQSNVFSYQAVIEFNIYYEEVI